MQHVRMALTSYQKCKAILMDPIPTLHQLRDEGLWDALAYFVIILLIYAVLSTIVITLLLAGFSSVTGSSLQHYGSLIPLIVFGFAIAGGLIGIFVGGAWLHLWVYLIGGRGGYIQTVKSLIYGSTPAMLLGWIPILSIIGAIWACALQVLGIRELHEVKTIQAIIAVLVAIIIPVLIFTLFFSYFLFGINGPGAAMYPV